MSQPIIAVQNLAKRYRLGELDHNRRLRESLARWFTHPFSRRKGPPSVPPRAPERREVDGYLWALRDINFEVQPGEVLGFVGPNGAGKSTLLKILTRVTEPTLGAATIRGRVGSLLEVGTGFHQELTGRENIYLNGAILGMTRGEITRQFDQIVDFAGVEGFIDTPIKRYSSGMALRLGFAVAAHLEPEILLVDEVLAVGDAEFQRKCLAKIHMAAQGGRTVVFVSHSMQAVGTLCTRALHLDRGQIVNDGPAMDVIRNYMGNVTHHRFEVHWHDPQQAPGNERVRLRSAQLVPRRDVPPEQIDIGTPFAIEVEYWNLKPDARLSVNLCLKTPEGTCVFLSPSVDAHWHGAGFPVGLYRSVCEVPGGLLNNGRLHADLHFVEECNSVLYIHTDSLVFDVHEYQRDVPWFGAWPGLVRPGLNWTTELLDPVISDQPPNPAAKRLRPAA